MKKYCFAAAILLLAVIMATALISCDRPYKLSFDKEGYVVSPQTVFTPNVNIFPKRNYTLISSNPTIAKINGKEIMAIKEGIVTITALCGNSSVAATLIIVEDDQGQGGALPSPIPEYARLSFVIEDYALLPPMQVRKGLAPGRPFDLQRGGYSLDGWYADKEMTIKYDFTKPLNEDTTVFGKWVMLDAFYQYEKLDDQTSVIKSLFFKNVPYTELKLPDKANDGTKVIGIANQAFKGKKTIENVHIPDSYEFIGEEAFRDCEKLKKVYISENSKLTTIRSSAFNNCPELTDIYLPPLITRIEDSAFYNCKKLDLRQDLPAGLATLEQYVFSKTAIQSVDLENVTKLWEGAFADCRDLYQVINTHNITLCHEKVFENTKIYADSVAQTQLAVIDTLLVGGINYTSFILDGNITLIADNAFGAASFKDLVIKINGEPPRYVGQNAFTQTTVIIFDEPYFQTVARNPDTQWYPYDRQCCVEFTENDFSILRYYYSNADHYAIRKYSGKSVHLDITQALDYDIDRIMTGSFTNNYVSPQDRLALKTLTIGKVSVMEDYAINNISTLIAIFIKGDFSKIPTIYDYSIAKNTLGDGAVKIYVPASLLRDFRAEWPRLVDRIYPDSVIMNDCAISSIEGSQNNHYLQYFGDEANVTIPDAVDGKPVTVIAQNAFRHNYSVKNLVIGANIKEISYAALTNTNLKTITFLSQEPPAVDVYFLFSNEGLEHIYVPQSSIALYREKLPSKFSLYITGITD